MLRNFYYAKVKDKMVPKLKRRTIKQNRLSEGESSFEALAAELRKSTEGSCQTPSEILLREGREER